MDLAFPYSNPLATGIAYVLHTTMHKSSTSYIVVEMWGLGYFLTCSLFREGPPGSKSKTSQDLDTGSEKMLRWSSNCDALEKFRCFQVIPWEKWDVRIIQKICNDQGSFLSVIRVIVFPRNHPMLVTRWTQGQEDREKSGWWCKPFEIMTLLLTFGL